MASVPTIPCPLCGESARLLDGPSPEWLTFEGCACGGFRVWADLVATRRLKVIRTEERGKLHARVLGLRAINLGAWLVTVDGTLDGPLIVAADRQDRPRRRSTDAR
jgi:hypothetical protein